MSKRQRDGEMIEKENRVCIESVLGRGETKRRKYNRYMHVTWKS